MDRNYHDWYLLGISTDINIDSIDLDLGSDGDHSVLRFCNVKRCLFDNFTIGNIILDVHVSSGNIESIERLRKSDSFNRLIGVDYSDSYFENILEGIKKGTLIYVEIYPSYGCSAQIICESVREIARSLG